jgi:plasmid stabilization system protein ParE
MDYQVVLSPSARADLRDIVRYISFDAADRALEFGRFLISRTQLLAQSPQLGRIVPEFEDASIREIIVRSYPLFIASTICVIWSRSFVFGTSPVAHRRSRRDDFDQDAAFKCRMIEVG